MSSCLYSTIFINRGTRRTLCVHEKNDDDDDDDPSSLDHRRALFCCDDSIYDFLYTSNQIVF